MNSLELDDLDFRLLDLLSKDARVSNRKIAAILGVTEGTIRGRIKRLQQENLIRFTAITNTAYLGSTRLVFLGIEADQAKVKDVAHQIAEIPPINCVIITLGRYQILAMGLFKDLDHIWEVANNRLRQVEGVRHVETSVAVRTIKYNDRMARITRSIEIEDEEEAEEPIGNPE